MIEYTVEVYDDGSKYWLLNGKLHREDGPAIEYPDGTKVWWLNDKLHREDGPAYEHADGHKEWWINDLKLTEEEFNIRTQVQEMTLEEVNRRLGYKVKIVE